MKKKILFINGHLNPGGVEKSLLDILRHFDYSKYDVELLLLEGLGDYAPLLPQEVHVRLVDLHNTYGPFGGCLKNCIKKGDWQSLWRRIIFKLCSISGVEKFKLLKKSIVGTENYDCVVGFRPGIVAALAVYATNAKKKILWWHHGEINLSEQGKKDFYKECKLADNLVTVSKGCAAMLGENFPEISDKIKVIPNMVDAEDICQKAGQYIPFNKEKGCVDLVTVGRLSPEKHVENAIIAAAVLKEKSIPFRWYIVGDGDRAEDLKRLAMEKGVLDTVVFVGNKSNPYPYMKMADLLVHTSYVESQCLVVLEAMALGRPCVVTESVGPSEFCEDGINCIYVKQNVESLLDGLIKVMKSKNLDAIIKKANIAVAKFLPNYVENCIEDIIR